LFKLKNDLDQSVPQLENILVNQYQEENKKLEPIPIQEIDEKQEKKDKIKEIIKSTNSLLIENCRSSLLKKLEAQGKENTFFQYQIAVNSVIFDFF
jgi:hypothetical protein